MQPAAGAGVVGYIDQLVGGDREAQPCSGLDSAVEHHLLIEAEAEQVGGEAAVDGDIGRQHVDVVQALDRRAVIDVALGDVLEPRAQRLGRLISLGLVEQLHAVAVGVTELVGGT